ncbi:hypothetical protein J2Y67_001271 [Neobacillus niacini]|nr:hypothetical protein [Neobacillus niacini]
MEQRLSFSHMGEIFVGFSLVGGTDGGVFLYFSGCFIVRIDKEAENNL